MRKLAILLSSFFSLALAAQTTGMVTVSSANLVDTTRNKINNATICFAPVDNSGHPISFRLGTGSGGQVISRPACTNVSSGAFSLSLADTTLTSPLNVCYSVTVTDNVSGNSLLGPGYSCVQPAASNAWCSSSTCNFDSYTPSNVRGLSTITPNAGKCNMYGLRYIQALNTWLADAGVQNQ